MNTFLEIEDPINLYHAERHIPSEANMEVPPPSAPSACVHLLTPKGTIFHIRRQRNNCNAILLLMTTYRQDIITYFCYTCVWDLLFTHFSGQCFKNMRKRTCQPFKVFMLKINYFTTISFKSNTSTWVSWPSGFSHFSKWPTGWLSGNTTAGLLVLLLTQALH